jgi:hypothetical protein
MEEQMADYYEDKVIVDRMRECLERWRLGRQVFDNHPQPEWTKPHGTYDQSRATFRHYATSVLIDEGEFPGLQKEQFDRCFDYVCAEE